MTHDDEIRDPVSACVSAFEHQHVLVLGDAIVDEYLYGDCSRISPEAPVPVLRVTSTRQALGGAWVDTPLPRAQSVQSGRGTP